MANHKSSKKRIIRNSKKAAINTNNLTRIRTFVKKVELALQGKDKTAAQQAFAAAMPELHKGITKGILHKKTASRKISRLALRVNAL